LVLAAGGAYLLIERSLAPVTNIMNAAENISLHNLSNRLPVATTGDKLEHLSRALNRMITRLDGAYQQASRFTADASHELRTPLTVMRGELESIMRQPHVTGELRDQIGSVLEETERLAHITAELLAIAQLEAGEAKIEHATFDLAELGQSTLEQMQLLAEEKYLAVTMDAPQPVFVVGDAARLKQVIVNLLDNAIKYTMTGGTITFSVKAAPPTAILSVKDNGIGIPSEELPHVFERFYRADKVRSRSSHGAGLGLSIVQIICQAHGGTVQVQSEKGIGTTVTVELPLADKSSRENIYASS
jgi:heavy metal sensor kinase